MYCSGTRYRAAASGTRINRTEEGDNGMGSTPHAAANLDPVFHNVGSSVWRSSTTCKIQHMVVRTSPSRLTRVPIWRGLLTTSWDDTRCLRCRPLQSTSVGGADDCEIIIKSGSVRIPRRWNSRVRSARTLPGLNELGTGPSEVDRTVAQGSCK